MADQVVARTRQIGKLRRFAFEFLDVVLAEIAQSQIVGFTNGGGGKYFGDGQQEDSGRIAPRPVGRARDPLAYGLQSIL